MFHLLVAVKAFLVGCVGGGGGRSDGELSVGGAGAEDGVETGAGVGAGVSHRYRTLLTSPSPSSSLSLPPPPSPAFLPSSLFVVLACPSVKPAVQPCDVAMGWKRKSKLLAEFPARLVLAFFLTSLDEINLNNCRR